MSLKPSTIIIVVHLEFKLCWILSIKTKYDFQFTKIGCFRHPDYLTKIKSLA